MDIGRPKIGLLLGDPTGIGPELICKLLAQEDIYDYGDIVIIGDYRWFLQGAKIANVQLPCEVVQDFSQVKFGTCTRYFLDFPTVDPQELTMGQVSGKAGKAVLDTLLFTLDLAKKGLIDAMVYGPLNKEAMHLGGSVFEDELRFFAHQLDWTGLCGEINVMDKIWTSRVTSHVGIGQVTSLLSVQRVYDAILLINNSLRASGYDAPRIGVSALNPHGGEGSLFGPEEQTIIQPAVQKAQGAGINAQGPYPADTIFLRARDGQFDAVVSMYHDQGQIAIKILGFDKGVTVNGGLPLAITTPAHGTAHDIAGQGQANPGAMRQAFLLGCRMGKGIAQK